VVGILFWEGLGLVEELPLRISSVASSIGLSTITPYVDIAKKQTSPTISDIRMGSFSRLIDVNRILLFL
jgi:hypothetical protein